VPLTATARQHATFVSDDLTFVAFDATNYPATDTLRIMRVRGTIRLLVQASAWCMSDGSTGG